MGIKKEVSYRIFDQIITAPVVELIVSTILGIHWSLCEVVYTHLLSEPSYKVSIVISMLQTCKEKLTRLKGLVTVDRVEIYSLFHNKAYFLSAVPWCLRCDIYRTRKRQRIK